MLIISVHFKLQDAVAEPLCLYNSQRSWTWSSSFRVLWFEHPFAVFWPSYLLHSKLQAYASFSCLRYPSLANDWVVLHILQCLHEYLTLHSRLWSGVLNSLGYPGLFLELVGRKILASPFRNVIQHVTVHFCTFSMLSIRIDLCFRPWDCHAHCSLDYSSILSYSYVLDDYCLQRLYLRRSFSTNICARHASCCITLGTISAIIS